MRRLPPYYVPRQRLVDRCSNHAVVLVEAAGGFGKSVLGAELIDSWGAVSIDVQLELAGVSAPLLAARVRSAVARAGFTEAAAAAAEAGNDPFGAVDAVLTWLAGERCAFIIDDAQNAEPDGAALIARMAERLEGEERMVILTRLLPSGAERLRRAEYLQLSGVDLALNLDETLELCRAGFGLEVGLPTAEVLHKATAGWTAATVLAAARAVRTGEDVGAVAGSIFDAEQPYVAVGAILQEGLAALGPENRPHLALLARLPMIDATVAAEGTGQPDFLARAIAAGIPFTPLPSGWWELPGPVRDHLSSFGAPDPEGIRRVAAEYERKGEQSRAVEILLACGDPLSATRMLVHAPPEAAEAMDVLELQAVLDRLPQDVIDAEPAILLVVARALRTATRYEEARALLDRVRSKALEIGDQVLVREVVVEQAHETFRQLRRKEAAQAAQVLLDAADQAETLTRAKAYAVLAESLVWEPDETGRLDPAGLVEAEQCFRKARELYLSLGMRSAASSLVPYWAIKLDLARGRGEAAMRKLDEALSLVVDRPRRWGYVMCFKTWVAAELGQDDLCRACAGEVLRVAEQLDSDLFRAHAHWKPAILCSYRGDADATVEHIRQVELYRGTWWESGSADFMAEAADLLDRVGEVALAREYLTRALAEPKDVPHVVLLSAAVLEARHGDPVAAEERLIAAADTPIEPREYWRLSLLRAYAAFRRGQEKVAGSLAARAFEEAARLGHHDLPLLREREITEQLLGLAIETGQPAALALHGITTPMALSLLGRFSLTLGGRDVKVGTGQEAQLLKVVAVSGGRIHIEQAIEILWPETDTEAGRNRLRTVLNRLRTSAGEALSRDGEMLVLDERVRVDLAELFVEGRKAKAVAASDLALGAAMARGAVVRYAGELLPDDRYAEWAEKPRERARQLMLDLLDLSATEAARRGDLDGVRRVVQQSIELAPYDDSLYARAAATLLEQGRRGEALSVLHRARSAFAEIGLPPPGALVGLEQTIFEEPRANIA